MAIIEQGNLSVSNALFGDKTFKARKVKVADFNVESVTDEWTENKEYEIKPSAGYDLIDKANITVDVIKTYTITTTISHGSASGDTSVEEGSTAQVTLTASENYALPFNITVVNASYTYDYTTGIVVISNMTDNVTISVECIDISSYPSKGDIIKMDLDGNGTDETYLVLKIVGASVEVLARATPSDGSSIAFAASGNTYAENALDTYLNTTYYATLSATAKAAIVDKTFTPDSWYWDNTGDPDYSGTYSTDTAYTISLGSATYGSEITRHIYAISVQDIIDYLGVTPEMTTENTTLNPTNIQTMFNNTSNNIWTRSAFAGSDNFTLLVTCFFGRVSYYGATNSYQARPAFQLDLTKIEWSKDNA